MNTLAGFTTSDLNVPWRGVDFPCRLVTPHAPTEAAPCSSSVAASRTGTPGAASNDASATSTP